MAEESFVSGTPVLPPQVGPLPDTEETAIENIQAADYAVQEIRVVKDRGYMGVLIPVSFVIVVPDSFYGGAFPIFPYQCPFFIANRSYQIEQISCRFQIAGTDVGGCTATVRKAASGVAYGSATAVMTGSFDIGTGAAVNTVVTITKGTATNYVNSNETSRLVEGDSLLVTIGNVTTGVHNVCFSVVLRAI